MALLQAVTRDLGIGLVVIGGSDSYGPGGYAGTTLETALPVQKAARVPMVTGSSAALRRLSSISSHPVTASA
jgi:hypothetical protein